MKRSRWFWNILDLRFSTIKTVQHLDMPNCFQFTFVLLQLYYSYLLLLRNVCTFIFSAQPNLLANTCDAELPKHVQTVYVSHKILINWNSENTVHNSTKLSHDTDSYENKTRQITISAAISVSMALVRGAALALQW